MTWSKCRGARSPKRPGAGHVTVARTEPKNRRYLTQSVQQVSKLPPSPPTGRGAHSRRSSLHTPKDFRKPKRILVVPAYKTLERFTYNCCCRRARLLSAALVTVASHEGVRARQEYQPPESYKYEPQGVAGDYRDHYQSHRYKMTAAYLAHSRIPSACATRPCRPIHDFIKCPVPKSHNCLSSARDGAQKPKAKARWFRPN